jgi:hypothetical protein
MGGRGMIDLKPIVLLLDGKGNLVTTFITKCDTCRKSLIDKKGHFKWTELQVLDDAVRPLYFCSEQCKKGMEAKIASNNGHFPNEKLSIESVQE